jgi:poly-gamma-glutamate synthesis protein (capsule biosynthesis protein)
LLLTFVGDIMAHEINFRMPDFARIYDGVRRFTLRDDLSFANLEFPVRPERPYASYPAFSVQPEYVEAAIRGGFEVFSLANNHSDDHGLPGIVSTAEALESLAGTARVHYSGLRSDQSAPFEPVTIGVRGWIVGFLAVTEFINTWRHNPYVHIVPLRNQSAREELLRTVAEHAPRYDLFVVSYHGGDEYSLAPRPSKVRFFQELAQAGADVVWGHHPHVLQPWERVDINGESRFIFYSTGNFISGQRSWLSPHQLDHYRAHTGDAALFRLCARRVDHRVVLELDELVPITNYLDPEHGVVVRTFSDVLGLELSEQWRRFYAYRHGVTQRALAASLEKAESNAEEARSHGPEQGGMVWHTAQ